jgi:hypothetical protein
MYFFSLQDELNLTHDKVLAAEDEVKAMSSNYSDIVDNLNSDIRDLKSKLMELLSLSEIKVSFSYIFFFQYIFV